MTQDPNQHASRWAWPEGRFSRNVGWNILGNVGGKLLGPAFQLLIARLLLPADYGIFAIAFAWLAVFEIGKDWGLTQSIVVRRGGKPETALQFTVQLATAFVFYGATLAVTPLAASRFGLPELNGVLPLVSLAAFMSAAADPIVTDCLLKQRYRHLALRQVVTALATGVVGLIFAYRGYGVYALAAGLLAGHAAGTLSLAVVGRASLGLMVDLRLMKDLLEVGKHIVLQRLFGFLVNQADSLIVGRALGPQAVGFYRMGNLLSFTAPTASVLQAEQVVFTELSANPDAAHLRRRYNLFTNVAGPLLLLYSIAAYMLAPALVAAVLGPQWQGAVPLMQIFAVAVITGFLTPLNIDLAKILGFPGTYTRYAAVRSTGTVVAILLASQYSTIHVVVTWVVAGLVSNLINDAIFYVKQDAVRLTYSKVAIIAATWAWAAFVIVKAFP